MIRKRKSIKNQKRIYSFVLISSLFLLSSVLYLQQGIFKTNSAALNDNSNEDFNNLSENIIDPKFEVDNNSFNMDSPLANLGDFTAEFFQTNHTDVCELLRIDVDEYGYLYTVGYIEGVGAGDRDMFLVKWDQNGTQIWNETWGTANFDYGMDVTYDKKNKVIYTTGWYKPGTYYDLVLVKWDLDGTVLWDEFYSTTRNDLGRCVTTDEDGNIYVGGTYDTYWSVLLKWAPTGGSPTVQTANFGSGAESIYDLLIYNNYIYTTGYYPSAGQLSYFLVKWDEDLNLITQIRGSIIPDVDQIGNCIDVDSEGNIIIGGRYRGTYINYSALLIKFDTSMNELWSVKWDTDNSKALGITIDKDNSIYTVGSYILNGQTKGLLLKWSENGCALWNRTFAEKYTRRLYGIVRVNDTLFSVGYSSDTSQFDGAMVKFSNLYGSSERSYISNSYIWGGNDDEDGANSGIAVDSLNNSYIIGKTKSYGAGDWDWFISKHNSAGILIWNKTWGGANADEGKCIALSSDENHLYLSGYSMSEGYTGVKSVILLKWDINGNPIWSWNSTDTTENDPYGISIASDGTAIYLTGTQYLTNSTSKGMFLIKINSAGTLIWKKYWDSNNEDQGRSITSSSDGEFIYQVGYSNAYWSNFRCVINKWTKDGALIWSKDWGKSFDIYAQNIAINEPNNSIYIVGYSQSSGITSENVFTVRLNLTGDMVWERFWGGYKQDRAWGILLDQTNIYVAGITESFNPNRIRAAFLIKYDYNGFLIWNELSNDGVYSEGHHIDKNPSGDIYMAGNIGDTGNQDMALLIFKKNNPYLYADFEWTDNDRIQDVGMGDNIIVGKDGYIYTAISVNCSFPYPIYNKTVLTKWDYEGNQIWNYSWGGNSFEKSYCLKLEESNNAIYVGGQVNDMGSQSGFISKIYTSNGSLIWNTTWGGTPNTAYISDIALSSNDDVLVAAGYDTMMATSYMLYINTQNGTIYNSINTGMTDIFNIFIKFTDDDQFLYAVSDSMGQITIQKRFSNGSMIWNKNNYGPIGTYSVKGFDLDSSSTGIYICGIMTDTIQYGFLSRFDVEGTNLWFRFLAVFENQWGLTNVIYSNNSLYTTGLSTCSSLTKWDLNGNIVWQDRQSIVEFGQVYSFEGIAEGYDDSIYTFGQAYFGVSIRHYRAVQPLSNPYLPKIEIFTPYNNSFISGNEGLVPIIIEVNHGINGKVSELVKIKINSNWYNMLDISYGQFTTFMIEMDYSASHGQNFQYYFNISNSFGHIAQLVELNFTIDNNIPNFHSFNIDSSTYLTLNTLLQVNTTDSLANVSIVKLIIQEQFGDKTRYPELDMNYNGSSTYWEYPWNFVSGAWDQGQYLLNITMEDKAGNQAHHSKSIMVDYTCPIVSLISPTNASILSGNITVYFDIIDHYSGINTKQIYLGTTFINLSPTSSPNIYSYNISTTDFADGIINIEIITQDNANLAALGNYSFTIDNSFPNCSLNHRDLLDTNNVLQGLQILNINCSDTTGFSRIAWKMDNKPYIDLLCQSSQTLSLNTERYTDGNHTIYILVQDNANPVNSRIIEYKCSIDNTAPQMSVLNLKYGETLTRESVLEIDVYDLFSTDCNLYYSIDDGPVKLITKEINETCWKIKVSEFGLKDGTHKIRFIANDSAGNQDIDEYLFVLGASPDLSSKLSTLALVSIIIGSVIMIGIVAVGTRKQIKHNKNATILRNGILNYLIDELVTKKKKEFDYKSAKDLPRSKLKRVKRLFKDKINSAREFLSAVQEIKIIEENVLDPILPGASPALALNTALKRTKDRISKKEELREKKSLEFEGTKAKFILVKKKRRKKKKHNKKFEAEQKDTTKELPTEKKGESKKKSVEKQSQQIKKHKSKNQKVKKSNPVKTKKITRTTKNSKSTTNSTTKPVKSVKSVKKSTKKPSSNATKK
jgi:hypothetical protein